LAYGLALVQVLVVFGLGRLSGWWWLAAVVVLLVELRALRRVMNVPQTATMDVIWARLPGVIVGLSVTLIMILSLRAATQIVLAALYLVWLVWRVRATDEAQNSLPQLLVVQAVMFEALFLMVAWWQTPAWLLLILVWMGAYASVYGALKRRGDRSAGVMAATWGVIATEVSWALLLWLITYTMRGGYVLVPQPALILTALGYVFGSILASSRQGSLSRARLGEYIVIAAVLVAIVVTGTSWTGSK
jgi:hypothetical protein